MGHIIVDMDLIIPVSDVGNKLVYTSLPGYYVDLVKNQGDCLSM